MSLFGLINVKAVEVDAREVHEMQPWESGSLLGCSVAADLLDRQGRSEKTSL
jgi:hypothetical protein